jgi:hypothetical protein
VAATGSRLAPISGCSFVAILKIQNEANFAESSGRREIVVKARMAGGERCGVASVEAMVESVGAAGAGGLHPGGLVLGLGFGELGALWQNAFLIRW